jgi:hypothetical protein
LLKYRTSQIRHGIYWRKVCKLLHTLALSDLQASANIKNYIDVVTLSASDLATKLHVPLEKAQAVLKQIHASFAPNTRIIEIGDANEEATLDILGQSFTTGDGGLDSLLGGGIIVGQVLEVTGEA